MKMTSLKLFSRTVSFDRLLITSAMMATVILLAVVVWNAHRNMALHEKTIATITETERLRGTIIHLDELLTMSARMAASTGDLQWETRYNHFEPKLDAAIKRAIALAPEETYREFAQQTDVANRKLVAMEVKSFEQLREGKPAEARDLLFSKAYDKQKTIYANGMAGFSNALKEMAETSFHVTSENNRRNLTIIVFVMIALVTGWAVVVRILRQAQHEMRRSNAYVQKSNIYVKQILSSMMDTLLIVSPEGYVEKVNRTDLLLYSENELVGMPIGQLFSEENETEEEKKNPALRVPAWPP